MSALPSPLLAEAQMLRDRAMSHYQARSLFGNSHRLNSRRNGLGFDRQSVMDRGVGVTVGRRTVSEIADKFKGKEVEGEPLLDANALKALIRLLRLVQVNLIGPLFFYFNFFFHLLTFLMHISTYFSIRLQLAILFSVLLEINILLVMHVFNTRIGTQLCIMHSMCSFILKMLFTRLFH